MQCLCATMLVLGVLQPPDLPGTLHVEFESWTSPVTHWSTSRYWRGSCRIDVAGDGSWNTECQGRTFEKLVIPGPVTKTKAIYDSSTRIIYYLDQSERTAYGSRCPCKVPDQRVAVPPNDEKCQSAVKALSPPGYPAQEVTRSGWLARKIAGFPVVTYRVEGKEDWDYDYEFSFAPSWNCTLMEQVTALRGLYGILTERRSRLRISRFDAGEPDGALFHVPAGFRIVNSAR